MAFFSTYFFVSLLKINYKLFWILSWLLLLAVFTTKVELKHTLNFIHFQSGEHFCYSVEYIVCVCAEYFKMKSQHLVVNNDRNLLDLLQCCHNFRHDVVTLYTDPFFS